MVVVGPKRGGMDNVNVYTTIMRKGRLYATNRQRLEADLGNIRVNSYNYVFHPTLPLLAIKTIRNIIICGNARPGPGPWFTLKQLVLPDTTVLIEIAFHPTSPLLFVANTKRTVAYNLDWS